MLLTLTELIILLVIKLKLSDFSSLKKNLWLLSTEKNPVTCKGCFN